MNFILSFVLISKISNGLIINEIMADPIADETLNEWIEIYNNEDKEIDVKNWIIGDERDNDTIGGGLYNKEGTVITPFGYALITDGATRIYNNFNVSQDAIRLYVDDGSIGNGLSNDGETFYIYDSNHNLIDKKEYNASTEGLSWSYIDGALLNTKPSPGFSNMASEQNISEKNCDYEAEIILEKTIFQNSSDFSFQVKVSKIEGQSTNFTATAKIEDIGGKLIREYKPFSNEKITKQRTSSKYTPNLEGGVYILSSNMSAQCDDVNSENNFDSRIIAIKEATKGASKESTISLEKIYDLTDETAKFGQIIMAKLNIYKGNTNKESISVWIEDKKGKKISKLSKVNVDSKNTEYSLTLPIQIDPNCDESFKGGTYLIIAQGLDVKDEEKIKIEGILESICTKSVEKGENNSEISKKFDFELKEFNEIIEVGKNFTSKIKLNNNDNNDISIQIWGYVYRGSKSYSGEREQNKKEFVLKANSLEIVELSNIADNVEPGDYKFKVVINKNNQKTNYEITRNITFIDNLNKVNSLSKNNNFNKKIEIKNNEKDIKNVENKIINKPMSNYGLVYQSSTEKVKALVPVFLIILSIIMNIVLIWRR